jgi:hypothetical protein
MMSSARGSPRVLHCLSCRPRRFLSAPEHARRSRVETSPCTRVSSLAPPDDGHGASHGDGPQSAEAGQSLPGSHLCRWSGAIPTRRASPLTCGHSPITPNSFVASGSPGVCRDRGACPERRCSPPAGGALERGRQPSRMGRPVARYDPHHPRRRHVSLLSPKS